MKDRRARLRPKDGARELYYGSGNLGSRSQSLLGQLLPWQAAKPLAELAPNAPLNIPSLSQIGATLTSAISGTLSGALENVGSAVGNFLNAGNILTPLSQTDGLVFPYTPIISYSQAVNYNSYDPVHSNQEHLAYVRTSAPQIVCSGDFTVQNAQEANYALACIHFLRVVSKMSFGQASQFAGTPPPVLIFSAYGEFMFNELPVVVQNFDIQFDNSVDYVQVPNTFTYVPSKFTITVSLTVQNSPQKMRSFNLDQFRKGQLMRRGGWV